MAWTAPRTYTGGETLTAAILNADLRDNLNAGFPVGSLHYYIRAATTIVTAVNGFGLECNGSLYTRATYSTLNTLLSGLGFPFGTGDGSTTAGLPDVQNRPLVAMGSGGHADSNALGDSDAQAKGSRAMRHGHTFNLDADPHTHDPGTLNTNANEIVFGATLAAGATYGWSDGTISGSTQSAGATVSGTVGGNALDTAPFVVAGVYVVKY